MLPLACQDGGLCYNIPVRSNNEVPAGEKSNQIQPEDEACTGLYETLLLLYLILYSTTLLVAARIIRWRVANREGR